MILFAVFFKIFGVHRSHHQVQHGPNADQTGHGVHGVIVDERGWINCAWRHDRHQFGNGQSFGLDQGLSLR